MISIPWRLVLVPVLIAAAAHRAEAQVEEGDLAAALAAAWVETREHLDAGRRDAALESLDRARGIADEMGDTAQFVNLSGFLQDLQFRAGRHEAVVATVREAKARLTPPGPGNAEIFARLGSNECLSLFALGRGGEALAVAEATLDRAEAAAQPPAIAYSWNLLGSVRHRLDRPVGALACFERALALLDPGHPDRAHVEVNRVTALHDLGAFGRVLAVSEALLDGEASAVPGLVQRLHQLRAAALWSLDDAGSALAELDAAETLAAGSRSGEPTPGLLLHRALILRDLERSDEALDAARRALEAQRATGVEDQDLAFALTGLGAAHELRARKTGDPADLELAEEHRRAAYELARRRRFPELAQFAAGLGWLLHRGMGRHEEAAELLELAVAETDKRIVSAAGLGDGERAALHGRHRDRADSDPYEQLARVRMALGDAEGAFLALERGRARALVDRLRAAEIDPLAEARRRARARGDAAAVEGLDALRDELGAARRGPPSSAESDEASARRGARLEVLRRRGAEIARDLVPPARRVAVAEIRSMLAPGEGLLLYSLGAEDCLAILVESGERGVHAFSLRDGEGPLLRPRIETLVERHRAVIHGRGAGDLRGGGLGLDTKERGFAVGAELFRLLAPPALWKRVRELDLLHVVPHGPLHRLPFESLVVEPGPDAAKTRFWIDAGPPVVYAASASVFHWSRGRIRRGRDLAARRDLVVVADPLIVAERPSGHPAQGALVLAGREPLRAGDVVTSRGGRIVESGEALARALAERPPGLEDRAGIWRDGERLEARIVTEGLEVAPGPAGEALREIVASRRERDLAWPDRRGLAQLPGARREAAAIAAVLKDEPSLDLRLLVGGEATEPALEARGRSARILHLAAHQLPPGAGGVATGRLVLGDSHRADVGSGDGYLDLEDLVSRWSGALEGCDLVVLSACGSRLGELARDESLFSLPFGFQAAGCPRVVGSLWPVDDASTAELMTAFYGGLKKKDWRARPEALREACRTLRRSRPEPFHWAPFVWIGAAD